jgi:hypothetical protein
MFARGVGFVQPSIGRFGVDDLRHLPSKTLRPNYMAHNALERLLKYAVRGFPVVVDLATAVVVGSTVATEVAERVNGSGMTYTDVSGQQHLVLHKFASRLCYRDLAPFYFGHLCVVAGDRTLGRRCTHATALWTFPVHCLSGREYEIREWTMSTVTPRLPEPHFREFEDDCRDDDSDDDAKNVETGDAKRTMSPPEKDMCSGVEDKRASFPPGNDTRIVADSDVHVRLDWNDEEPTKTEIKGDDKNDVKTCCRRTCYVPERAVLDSIVARYLALPVQTSLLPMPYDMLQEVYAVRHNTTPVLPTPPELMAGLVPYPYAT